MQRDAFNLRGNQKEGKHKCSNINCNGCLDLFALQPKWKYQWHLHHQDADLRFGKVMWSEQAAYSSCLDHMLCYLLIHFELSPLSSSTATEIFDSMTDSKFINWSINKPDHTAVGHFRFWSISDWRPASKSIPAIHVVCEKEDILDNLTIDSE